MPLLVCGPRVGTPSWPASSTATTDSRRVGSGPLRRHDSAGTGPTQGRQSTQVDAALCGSRWTRDQEEGNDMKCRIVLSTVAVTMAGALTAAACGSSVSAEIDRDRQLDADMAAVVASGVPGVALGLSDQGNTTRLAQGLGDVASGTPMGVDDRVRIGSLSKSYVAVLVLQLVDEGRL